jgi:hypothetical protein
MVFALTNSRSATCRLVAPSGCGHRDLQLLRGEPVGAGQGARWQVNAGGLKLVVRGCSPTVCAYCAEGLPRRV